MRISCHAERINLCRDLIVLRIDQSLHHEVHQLRKATLDKRNKNLRFIKCLWVIIKTNIARELIDIVRIYVNVHFGTKDHPTFLPLHDQWLLPVQWHRRSTHKWNHSKFDRIITWMGFRCLNESYEWKRIAINRLTLAPLNLNIQSEPKYRLFPAPCCLRLFVPNLEHHCNVL